MKLKQLSHYLIINNTPGCPALHAGSIYIYIHYKSLTQLKCFLYKLVHAQIQDRVQYCFGKIHRL